MHVGTGSYDIERHLVFADGYLVAVLVQLCAYHEENASEWSLEAGFGPVDDPNPPIFDDLDEARSWIERRLDLVS